MITKVGEAVFGFMKLAKRLLTINKLIVEILPEGVNGIGRHHGFHVHVYNQSKTVDSVLKLFPGGLMDWDYGKGEQVDKSIRKSIENFIRNNYDGMKDWFDMKPNSVLKITYPFERPRNAMVTLNYLKDM